jgi:hypothetical protein
MHRVASGIEQLNLVTAVVQRHLPVAQLDLQFSAGRDDATQRNTVVGLVTQLPTIQVHGLTATVLELDPLASQIGPDRDGEQGGIADSAAWASNR